MLHEKESKLPSLTHFYIFASVVFKALFELCLPSQYPHNLIIRTWTIGRFTRKTRLHSSILWKLETNPYDVDVFYIHPTITTSRKNSAWNGNVSDENYRQATLNTAIKYQCSAWYGLGRTFAPFYRDAHIRSFQDQFKPVGGDDALRFAYEDIKSAFKHYLKHENNGRPIVLVSHSQGTLHAGQLLKDFFEDQPLQKQLVAAYLVGIAIKPEYFQNIPFMTSPAETGGFVTWNTYKRNHLPDDYEKWYKGSLVTNPITWDDQKITDL